MKKFFLFRRIICCLLILLMITTPAAATTTSTTETTAPVTDSTEPTAATVTDVDLSIEQGAHSIEGKIPVVGPLESLALAPAAILYDVTDDTIVYSTDPDGSYNPAGLVKLMTALIVAEKCDMNDMITITQETLDDCYGSLGIELQVGEVISMYDLMNCLLVEGANVAAVAAAKHVSGDLDTFVAEMNTRAAELGCTGTVFKNVHGLHDEEQVTTARDMVRIVSALCKNSFACEAFSTYAVRTSPTNMSEDRRLYNPSFIFNKNLGSNHYDARVSGCKIGETIDGKRNIAVTATDGTVELIGVILGSTSEISPDGNNGFYKEIRILLDRVLDGHYSTKILYENQVLEQFEVKNGDNYVTAYAKDDVLTSLPNNITNEDLTYLYKNEDIQAPIVAGQKISFVQIWYNNVCLAQTDLYALHDVDVKEVIETAQMKEESGTNSFTVLTVVIIIVGLLLLLLFGRGIIFRLVHNLQMRRQKRERRRRR